ncbi:MAG: CvpA family protein [Candidatus Omnitrophica bacterium]|nr:CvpA family protein [Candidatus Omnitrophota bacterium]
MPEIIKRLNWVDLFVIILLFRILYVSLNSGFAAELFKLLGTITAVYISLHYFTFFSDWLVGSAKITISKESMPLEFMDFISFVILALVGYIFFVGLRAFFCRFIKMEAVPTLNKWGGLVLGIARGFLLASLIIFMLVISTLGYLRNSTLDSYLGSRIYKIAPATYNWIWNSLTSKFMGKEELNKTILEVSRGLNL